jgi:CDGSH-type Zn-finger protein
MEDRKLLIERARIFWDGFYRCPTTGRILEGMKGDDKVLCRCGRSNPKVPTESTEQTGVHIRRFLASATAEEYVDQQIAQRAAAKQ